MWLNLPFGLSTAINQQEWDDNKKNRLPWCLQNLLHMLNMTDESDISYIEGLSTYKKVNNRFQVNNHVVLIHKNKIFLYEKSKNTAPKNIKILDTIEWVNPIEEEVFQSEIIRNEKKAYIAYGFFPQSMDDVVYGYKVHMITLDLENNHISYDKIIDGHNSENEPKLHIIAEEFALRTAQGEKCAIGIYAPKQNVITYQHYNPETGSSLQTSHR